MTTFSGLVYVTHGRVGSKSEGPDYHLQTSHADYLLRYKERYLWEPDYHLEFFGRRMVEVEGKLVGTGVIEVESICDICKPLIPESEAPGTSPVYVHPNLTSVAVVTLDFETLQIKDVYISYHQPCGDDIPRIDDDEFKARALGLFVATAPNPPRHFEVSHLGDFVVLVAQHGDFGGSAVLDPCSGRVLHAGTIIWMGRGQQLYPAEPLSPETIKHTGQPAPSPERFDVLSSPLAPSAEEAGKRAWESIQDLNIVQEFATAAYSVLVYLYPRSVGAFDPGSADWVVFVHRDATGGP